MRNAQIKAIYNEFAENDYQPTEEKKKLDDLMEQIVPQARFFDLESAVNLAIDREAETAFLAGFRCAVRLFVGCN